MLPQAGLIIPLYVVLARYHLTNTLTGVILTYMTFVLPFAVWTLRGFILGIPRELEEAAMVDGSSRLGAFLRILLAARGAGARRHLGVRVRDDLERVHLRGRPAQRPVATDGDRLALVLLRHEPEHRLGRPHGGLDADRDPRRHLLPARAAPDRVRTHRRRRPGMSAELARLANGCILPGFAGLTAPEWLRRELDAGLGGVVLFARNVRDGEQLASSTAAIRVAAETRAVAIDEEGGDVTRLEVGPGSSCPGISRWARSTTSS